jgi:hypothetical protein
VVHALALWAVWASLASWPRYLAGVAIVASLVATFRRALLRSGQQTVSLELHEDGRAAWRSRAGTWHEGRLGSAHFVSGILVVVELKRPGGGPNRVVLLADSAGKDDLRRLRVWVRWQRAEQDPK